MAISLYDVSVASYLQVLGGIRNVLIKGEQHATSGGLDLQDLVRYKLRDEMLPFSFQVISVWHHSFGAVKGLKAGEFAPPPKMSDLDYAALQGLVDVAIESLQQETREAIDNLAESPLVFKLGDQEIPFSSADFVTSFSLPNFYFHATTTYTMLRSHGVPLGKMDYLGALRVDN